MNTILCKTKTKSNKFINGETVNYTIAFLLSFFALICIKQIFKTFLGVSTEISVTIGFIISEIILYFAERYFVFRDDGLNGNIRQILFALLGGGIHFAIYSAIKFVLCDRLGAFDFTAWFISAILIFIINYPFARLLIFDCISLPEKKKNGRIYKAVFEYRFVLLSMALATLCLVFIYSVFKVFPFGDTTVLRMDLYHQYGPLFVELFDRVVERKSFIYSFTSGGGSSFLGNYFNYLSSPLTALIFLFDRVQMPYAITFLVGLKCILSAGTFTFYLKKSQKANEIYVTAFGILYAFSAYFLAYFWNIMWIDAMFLFPLIILGIERIINKGKPALYIISLILLLYSNYYMGYMACIFAVIYFIAYYFMNNSSSAKIDSSYIPQKKISLKAILNNKLIDRGLRFAGASLLAGLLCAFFLLPVYFILTGSSATSGDFPKTAKLYFSAFEFIKSHFAFLETTIRSSGEDVLPNVYCGVISLILVPLFVVNKNIKMKEKGIYISILLFLFVSFDVNILNYIWHAFHFPNDLPYRFSYMYSFILLVISYKALKNIKYLGIKEIGFTSMAWVAMAVIAEEMKTEKMKNLTPYMTIAFIIIWCAVLFLAKKKNFGKAVIGTMIISVAFCEIIVADTKAFSLAQKQTDYVSNYETYREDINYIKENDKDLYKSELTNLNTRMDPGLYGYDGISTFSSMAYEDYSHLQYSLGMFGNRINSYTYNTQTPVYNMMYNIKYLIYKDEKTRPSTDLYTKFYESSDGESVVFKNDYFLPISFCVSENINGWDTTENNPFRVQGEFFEKATGYSDVFKEVNYTNCSYDGVTGENIANNGSYWFSPSGDFGNIDITVKPNTNGNMYLYITSKDITNVTCKSGEDTVTQSLDTPYILDLGYKTIDDEVTISLDCTTADGSDGNFDIYCYSIDKNVLDMGYNKLKVTSMNIEDFSETKITGKVTAKENCVLYSSIPYDSGWSVTVDGEKTETFGVGNCQLGIMLKPGEHTIEYKYKPKGLMAGSAVSLVTVLGIITALFIIIMNKKDKEKYDKNIEQNTPNNDKIVKSLK